MLGLVPTYAYSFFQGQFTEQYIKTFFSTFSKLQNKSSLLKIITTIIKLLFHFSHFNCLKKLLHSSYYALTGILAFDNRSVLCKTPPLTRVQ